MKGYQHVPVLLEEVISLLAPRAGENFVDATLGGGGYTRAILDRVKPDGKVLAIDLDQDAIESQGLKIKDERLILVQGNFARIDHIVRNHKFTNISGIVADLGLSSFHLDESGRGFTFQKDEPLDMRFQAEGDIGSAHRVLNAYTTAQLANIFKEYGEEKFSDRIAREITANRDKRKEIKTTSELYKIIQYTLPKPVKHRADDSARRIFQAIRVEVNSELKNLQEFLPKAFDLLNPGGKMAIVSFHSLEDRVVKNFFKDLAKGCVCPPEFPQCVCGKNPQGKILTKKPVTAGERELKENSRSKPAKLRAILKI